MTCDGTGFAGSQSGSKSTVAQLAELFAPHAQTVPSFFSARMRPPPLATRATLCIFPDGSVVSTTCTGVCLSGQGLPRGHHPGRQRNSVPRSRRCRRFSAPCSYLPAATIATLVKYPLGSAVSTTCPGVFLLLAALSPSWPSLLKPHDHTVPSIFNARLWPSFGSSVLPQETDATCDMLRTFTGTVLLLLAPSPNCPSTFDPHIQAAPEVGGEVEMV